MLDLNENTYSVESKQFTESPAQESLLFCKITEQGNIHQWLVEAKTQ